jgi:hypothetical protein
MDQIFAAELTAASPAATSSSSMLTSAEPLAAA